VEEAICILDRERDFELQDAQAIEILDLLLDLYAFGDPPDTVAAKARALGCERLVDSVREQLGGHDRATVAMTIATVRFTAHRRASGGRQHIDLLHTFCDLGVPS
jgi:hypothetical protein